MTLPSDFDKIAAGEKPRKKRKAQPESWVKEEIKKAMKEEAPEAYFYMPVQGVEGENGIPDFIASVPVTITPDMVGKKLALFVGIEAKADDGRLSPGQKVCHKKMKASRAIIWVITGALGIKELKCRLRDLLNAPR